MLRIVTSNNEYEFEFDGLKIFQSDYPTKVFKTLFSDTHIYIDGMVFKKDDLIYINELTKAEEFINLTKKSFLFKDIENICDSSLINTDKLNEIVDLINKKYNYEILTTTDGDIIKIINQLVDTQDIGYLNLDLFRVIIDNINFDTKKIIVFDNVSWINVEFLSKYLNEFYFIILTSDVRNYLVKKEMLELVVNNSNNQEFVDFLSYEKVIAYLEKNINEEIDNRRFNDFIMNKDSLFSIRCLELIKKI